MTQGKHTRKAQQDYDLYVHNETKYVLLIMWGHLYAESDSSSIASPATGARVGTITEDITLASSSTISSRPGNSPR